MAKIKKRSETPFSGGFWDEESRGKKIFPKKSVFDWQALFLKKSCF